ncbi:YchJ family protein [Marinobacter sp. F4206]|uniref:YchJ family protein n=1 Tax=Marinobacter sp. F4206 TaxID=2861777 RepID=UPI001C5DCFA5|nr:YchJ family metal-binding protein [Marinobacter sp. F4206]MBW4935354.1 SEC-C domain-containing protein [Marinobacter sp. F4206]
MTDQPSPDQTTCPCGSGQDYGTCCQPYHLGEPAASPETLMRSRYSAFVLGLTDYLLTSWHTSTRPDTLNLQQSPDWASLQILGSSQKGRAGMVHFRALYRAGSGWGYLEEHSEFVREQDRWFYVAGDTREGPLKPGRNEPCPCGSGRKYKTCCLKVG